MPLDALNQLAWTIMSDWMNRRNAQYSLENQLKAQEGWSKYQQEGAGLETQRQLDQLQAQKEAAAFMSLLGMSDKDDPSSLRLMEIVKSLGPEFLPPATEGLAPGMQAGGEALAKMIPSMLEGNIEGLDLAQGMKSGGGIQNIIRMLETGMNRKSLQDQLPSQRLNAASNFLSEKRQASGGTTGASGDITDEQRKSLVGLIGRAKADVDRHTAKFLPSSSGSWSNELMNDVINQILPKEMRKDPNQAKAVANRWIEEVGIDFFDALSAQVTEIEWRTASGKPINNVDYRIVVDSQRPYQMSRLWMQTKDDLLAAYQKREADFAAANPGYTQKNFKTLWESDPTTKEVILQDIWNAMYGGQ